MPTLHGSIPSFRFGNKFNFWALSGILGLEIHMATNKPTGDNARKGAVKKRSQFKTKLGGATVWTKRNKKDGEFMAVKKPAKKKTAAKKFKGIRREK
jgi:hypothetical protein